MQYRWQVLFVPQLRSRPKPQGDLASFASWQFNLLENGGEEVLQANTLREMHRVHWVDTDWKTTHGIKNTEAGARAYVQGWAVSEQEQLPERPSCCSRPGSGTASIVSGTGLDLRYGFTRLKLGSVIIGGHYQTKHFILFLQL